jgi:hypothetical protein
MGMTRRRRRFQLAGGLGQAQTNRVENLYMTRAARPIIKVEVQGASMIIAST